MWAASVYQNWQTLTTFSGDIPSSSSSSSSLLQQNTHPPPPPPPMAPPPPPSMNGPPPPLPPSKSALTGSGTCAAWSQLLGSISSFNKGALKKATTLDKSMPKVWSLKHQSGLGSRKGIIQINFTPFCLSVSLFFSLSLSYTRTHTSKTFSSEKCWQPLCRCKN